MLVHKPTKKLVLNLRDPDRVTAIIPTAKKFTLRGAQLVAVPHRLEEVRVLRNMGFDAPGPIRTHYDWPGLYKPYEHQIHTAELATLSPELFILNDMGTGKTLSVLWAFDFLRRHGYIEGSLLVVGPLSTLERTWADEVFRHFPHLTCAVLHGTAERRMKLIDQGADVYVINHDGIKSKPILERLEKMVIAGGISVVAPDELAAFRNAGTERWKALNRLLKHAQYRWGMTGTPIPNEPTDAWAQIRLISPTKVPKFFGAFRDAVMKQISQYKWVAREGSLDHVYNVMQPAVRYARKDCIDLPPTTFQTFQVELEPDQNRMYKEMLAKFKAEHEGGQITALNEGVKQMKLLQIVCGVAYGKDGNDVEVPARGRIELCRELIEQSGSKVIVFVPFRGALEYLARELRKDFTVEVVHGGIGKAERDQIFGNFQKTKDPRVIVAQPGTMSHGLTLTAASTTIWFAPITSAEIYQQANARTVRPGQKLNTLIAHIEGSALERKMYERLEKRGTTQGVLLEMFKA